MEHTLAQFDVVLVGLQVLVVFDDLKVRVGVGDFDVFGEAIVRLHFLHGREFINGGLRLGQHRLLFELHVGRNLLLLRRHGFLGGCLLLGSIEVNLCCELV